VPELPHSPPLASPQRRRTRVSGHRRRHRVAFPILRPDRHSNAVREAAVPGSPLKSLTHLQRMFHAGAAEGAEDAGLFVRLLMPPTPGRQSDIFLRALLVLGNWSRLRSVLGRRKWATQSIPHGCRTAGGGRGAGVRVAPCSAVSSTTSNPSRVLCSPQRPQRETPTAGWKCGTPGLSRSEATVLACGPCAGGMQ
jgi:hypothetical protein